MGYGERKDKCIACTKRMLAPSRGLHQAGACTKQGLAPSRGLHQADTCTKPSDSLCLFYDSQPYQGRFCLHRRFCLPIRMVLPRKNPLHRYGLLPLSHEPGNDLQCRTQPLGRRHSGNPPLDRTQTRRPHRHPPLFLFHLLLAPLCPDFLHHGVPPPKNRSRPYPGPQFYPIPQNLLVSCCDRNSSGRRLVSVTLCLAQRRQS